MLAARFRHLLIYLSRACEQLNRVARGPDFEAISWLQATDGNSCSWSKFLALLLLLRAVELYRMDFLISDFWAFISSNINRGLKVCWPFSNWGRLDCFLRIIIYHQVFYVGKVSERGKGKFTYWKLNQLLWSTHSASVNFGLQAWAGILYSWPSIHLILFCWQSLHHDFIAATLFLNLSVRLQHNHSYLQCSMIIVSSRSFITALLSSAHWVVAVIQLWSFVFYRS